MDGSTVSSAFGKMRRRKPKTTGFGNLEIITWPWQKLFLWRGEDGKIKCKIRKGRGTRATLVFGLMGLLASLPKCDLEEREAAHGPLKWLPRDKKCQVIPGSTDPWLLGLSQLLLTCSVFRILCNVLETATSTSSQHTVQLYEFLLKLSQFLGKLYWHWRRTNHLCRPNHFQEVRRYKSYT